MASQPDNLFSDRDVNNVAKILRDLRQFRAETAALKQTIESLEKRVKELGG